MDCNTQLLQKHRQHLVQEYHLVKAKKHTRIKTVTELAQIHGVSRKHLWELSGRQGDLLPRKRGPKRQAKRTSQSVEQEVCLRYQTECSSSERLKANYPHLPSARTIRRIVKRYSLKPKPIKPVIIRYEHANPGDLIHVDLKKIPNVKGKDPKDKQYLVGFEDDHTRIIYQERIPNKQAQTVRLAFQRAYDWFKTEHHIEIKKLLSDNGTEFTTHHKASREKHIFEKTLKKYGVIHKYTKPYRPQTNGKIERYWQIWENECWKTEMFSSWEQVDSAIQKFQGQYNHWRKHGGIGYKTPIQRLKQWQEAQITFFLALLLCLLKSEKKLNCQGLPAFLGFNRQNSSLTVQLLSGQFIQSNSAQLSA